MANAPLMPLGYGSTGFRLQLTEMSPILSALDPARTSQASQSEQDLEHQIAEAVWQFMDAKDVSEDPKNFRLEAEKLRKTLSHALEKLPDDNCALANSLNSKDAHYTHQCEVNLTRSYIVMPASPLQELRSALHRVVTLVEKIAVDEKFGRHGIQAARADHRLVDQLGSIYEHYTGQRIKAGTNSAMTDQKSRAVGHFSNFVNAVETEMMKQFAEHCIGKASSLR